MSRSSGSETQLRPDSFRRLFPEVPEGTPGTGTMVRASRWTPWRCDAVLEIGCPAPHPTASCDDLSIDHGQKLTPAHQACPLRLEPPPRRCPVARKDRDSWRGEFLTSYAAALVVSSYDER